jgi:hypothetical protein
MVCVERKQSMSKRILLVNIIEEDVFGFDDAKQVALYLWGKPVDHYLIIKNWRSFKPVNADVMQIQKQIERA